ncbi:MAG: PHP domain-containing protein [Anaerofustis sp.]
MRLTKDIHTHTCYSHGNATIEEMVCAAISKGLNEIHITEHGYAHYYAKKINRTLYLDMRRQIEKLRVKYPQIRILFGVEANIVSSDGEIDIEQDMDLFDVVNAGFHVMCKMKNLSSWLKISLPAFLAYRCKLKFLGKYSVRCCTQAVIGMLERYPIYMITHPMSNYPFDLRKVAEKCVETGTILEINNNRGKLNAQEVNSVMDLNIMFGIGSDAHTVEKVGSCERSFAIIRESGVPLSKVMNVADD